ncbi:Fe-S cluster assembly protein SufD [Phenylobacterium montanum]|uniref:Fe-S cluster assembly protein SufD n=1 Tax=Phenylobacterium montanum TaxID=2823693 RepID=A0A975IUU4_9CAUL|nr:Fe-S cluster assembly protein SufD [Caulobacter sp. S6]QUD88158.1 Fe-S cluster assembly protein SufD [Caulobacter sp. S6]
MTLARAIASGDVAQLPSRREEDWRWTDLRGLIRTIPAASPAADGIKLKRGPFRNLADEEIVFVNGRQLEGPSALIIEPGHPGPLALRFVSAAHGTAHHAAFSLVLRPGAELVLLESYESLGEAYLADISLDIHLGEGARLERVAVVAEAADAVSISQTRVELAPHARFVQTVLTSGAKRQRHETRLRHPGGGAEVRLDGVYLLDGAAHADLTTAVTHAGVDGVTQQLTKGAVRGQARAVFQGRIVVAEGADRTDARMGHHALILSDKAEVDAKPELEIYADDVSCAHGNTVGAIDEQALFYAMQRGIPEAEARAMLTEAFVAEVIDRIEHPGAREAAHAWAAQLAGRAG